MATSSYALDLRVQTSTESTAAPESISVELDVSTISRLRGAAVGEQVVMAALPTDAKSAAPSVLKRISVYAADARVWHVNGDSRKELERSNWLSFVSDKSAAGTTRMGITMTPDGRHVEGILLGEDGVTYRVESELLGKGLRLLVRDSNAPINGQSLSWNCGENYCSDMRHATAARASQRLPLSKTVSAVLGGSRTARVAVDTDVELLSQKFGNNTTTANNYLVSLFTQMSVIYERDFDLSLVIGDVFLRTGAVGSDPWSGVEGGPMGDQLDEFGEFWSANNGALNRAFAMQLSGKESGPSSAQGLAWLLGGGNYCNAEGATFACPNEQPNPCTLCSDGTCTFGHYSVSRLFTSTSIAGTQEVDLVAHELGHNFGAEHTHCTDTSAAGGLQPIDQCFNGEGGCYSGATSCPASSTVNGVSNVRGTLMSYCHISPGGCSATGVFADFHRNQITPDVLNNVVLGCFTSPLGPNQAPAISRPASIAVTEDTATSLSGISFVDLDAGAGTLNVTLSVPGGNGTIAATSSGGVSVVSGSGTNSLQVSGNLVSLNAWFLANGSNPDYTPAANASGNVTLTILVNDNGNSGTGGALSDSDTSTLMISAVNDAPVNTLPASFTIAEDTTTALVGMSLADVDVAASSMTFNLSVPAGQGTFTAANAGSVTVTGSTSNSLTLTGTATNLNAYLANASNRPRYVPVVNNTATVTLTVTSSDGGATGSGGARTDVDTRSLNFTAANDGPSANMPSTQVVASTGATPIGGITISDVDSASGNLDVVLSVNQGVLTASNNDGVTVVSGSGTATLTLLATVTAYNNFFGNNRVSFNPNGSSGNTTLTLNCDDNGNFGSGSSIACTPRQMTLVQGIFGNGFE